MSGVTTPGTTTPGTTSARTGARAGSLLVTVLLVLAAVGLVVVSLVLAPAPPEGEEAFVGTDSTATAEIEAAQPDYEPWFAPLVEPASGEIESGLFAVQAALGAGLLGYVLGALRARRPRE